MPDIEVNSTLFPVGGRLLAFARELRRAASFVEVLDVARAEVRAAIGFDHAWLCVADEEEPAVVRVLVDRGAPHDAAWEVAPRIAVDGDPLMQEIFAADGPVVVEDARTDPRASQAGVAQLGNRTIVGVPLRLLDKPFGAFGCGTFGDEGVRVPGIAQLEDPGVDVQPDLRRRGAHPLRRSARRRRTGEGDRRPPVPRPEAREPGPARRRHRPRLRQPADRHPDQLEPGLGAIAIRWSARS